MFVGSGRLGVSLCGTIGNYPRSSLLQGFLIGLRHDSCTLHRVIPGAYKGPRRGIRTTVFGEKHECK